jgi:hypothetical protein
MKPVHLVGPDLRSLFALFGAAGDEPEYERVLADEVPEPYHSLLVHEHHMTVTVEAFHADLVDVHVLDRRHADDSYARKILLELQRSRRVVQFGIVRIHLQYCSEEVKAAIISEKTPLGRILIDHDVLRRIQPTDFLRVMPGPKFLSYFGLTESRPMYGRLALIHCDEKPAIELLEIVAPE